MTADQGALLMLRQFMACALTVLFFWSGDSLAQTAESDTVKVGDRWSYDVKDDATGDLRQAITVVVTDINAKEITTRVTVRGKDRPNTVIYALDWGRIDDGRWRNRPAEIGIQMPLQVGKEWRSDTNGQSLKIRCHDALDRRCKGCGAGKRYHARRHIRHL